MVTSELIIPNPPHAIVRVYKKKIKNGNASLYLDYNIRGIRHQECMKLYLMNEMDLKWKFKKEARLHNISVLTKAMELRMVKEKEILNQNITIEENGKNKKLHLYIENFMEESRQCRKGNSYVKTMMNVKAHIAKFLGEKFYTITLEEVTPQFCRRFIEYFRKATKTNGKLLSPTSASHYIKFFRSLLDNAVMDDMIIYNPFSKLKKHEFIKRDEYNRATLTENELKKFLKTPCSNNNVKQAFLFSCYTGLRLSDVIALKWRNLKIDLSDSYMEIVMRKTGKPLSMKLSRKAVQQLPNEAGSKESFVFSLPSRTNMSRIIHLWTKKAHIQKNVTYHTSRHTFGTMLASRGVNIQTIQKLMGHRCITSTSFYVEVTDKAKNDAIDLL